MATAARTFLGEDDYALYRDLLAEHRRQADVAVWAWGVMPNHVHLVLVPSEADGLRRALAGVHRRYAGAIHARRRRTGHFWPGPSAPSRWTRLTSRPRCATSRSIPCARLVGRAPDRRWSSTRAHLTGRDDGVTARAPVRERAPDLAQLLAAGEPDAAAFARLRADESVGRPLGDDRFLARLERTTRRRLKPRRRGPKPRTEADEAGEQMNALSP